MSNKPPVGGNDEYNGSEAIVENAKKVKDKCNELKGTMPKGISFQPQGNKYLYLQWNHPLTGGRTSKQVGVPFTEEGVYQARDKAWKIKDSFSKFSVFSVAKLGKSTSGNRTLSQRTRSSCWHSTQYHGERQRSRNGMENSLEHLFS